MTDATSELVDSPLHQHLDRDAVISPAAPELTLAVLETLGLTPSGIRYVIDSATLPPSRKVGRKRRRNLILEVPMKSLPVVLQAESLTGEYAFLVRTDRRGDLVGIFDQPQAIPIPIIDRNGNPNKTTYTGDYLVADHIRVTVFEIKADQELLELVRTRPTDWKHDETGYHCVPVEAFLARMGICHVVVSTSQLGAVLTDNLRLLSSSRKHAESRSHRKLREGIMTLVTREKTLRIGDVMETLGIDDATPFIQLIDRGRIFADLEMASLSRIRDVWISVEQSLADLAQETTSQLGILLAQTDGLDANKLPNPRHELETATRLAILAGITRRRRNGNPVSSRTLSRYRRTKRENPNNQLAIEPAWASCGNREARFTGTHVTLIQATIRAGKRDPADPSIQSCFNDYEDLFPENRIALGITDDAPCKRSTFYNYWHSTPLVEGDSACKGGRRLENAYSDSQDPRERSILATRAFAVAHIDHWKADFHLVVAMINGKKITMRPWLTAMVDMFTGEVLAIWLSFANPSKRACTMVFRDCVRRHGRLPEMIVADGGGEFKSAHYLVMLATLGVTRCERPPEDPRYGKEVERVFKQFKERFARGLPGYGLSIERARAVSASLRSSKTASLTLMEGFEAIEAFVFRGYNNEVKPGTLIPRSDLRISDLRKFPFCGLTTVWDLRFLIATSIEPPDSEYTLWPGRGIHLNDKWYCSPALLRFRGYKKDFTVRVEPFADAFIYVRIEGKWIVCANEEARMTLGMSDRRLVSASCEAHELAALRRELANELNRESARIVNAKLEEIAARHVSSESKKSDSSPNHRKSSKKNDEGAAQLDSSERSSYLPFDFEDIEVLDEET